jgi:eukaryotic-like serine/threonine-protein kinase
VRWRVRKAKKSRYEVLVRIASGGMGIVYVGRKRGAVGFSRLVAIKRAHPHLHEDPSARRALLGEAALASRLHDAHVVAVQDVELIDDEILLVMDYVEGASLSRLMRPESPPMPRAAAVRIVLDACAGLQAAHDLKDDDGKPLDLVHRDVSPQNILVGLDGLARLTDFGIAKSATAVSAGTAEGVLKGKLGYLAPEYIEGAPANVRSDVYALGVIAWELLTRKRLYAKSNDAHTLKAILDGVAPLASSVAPELPDAMDEVLARALAPDPADRCASAIEFANEFEAAAASVGLLGTHAMVAAHVRQVAGKALEERRERIATAVAGGLDDVAWVGPSATRPGSDADTASGGSAPSSGEARTRAAAPQSIRPPSMRSANRRTRALLLGVTPLVVGAAIYFGYAAGRGDGRVVVAPVAASTSREPVASAPATTPVEAPHEPAPLPPPATSSEAIRVPPGVTGRNGGHPRLPSSAPVPTASEKAPPNPYAASSK